MPKFVDKEAEKYDRFTLTTFFNLWYKHEKDRANVSRVRYTRIAKRILKAISREIIKNHKPYLLPSRLGYLSVKRTNYKTSNLDLSLSTEKGRRIFNPRIKRIPLYKFHWKKMPHKNVNLQFYRFKEVVGCKKEIYGRLGLTEYIRKTIDDPFVQDYERL